MTSRYKVMGNVALIRLDEKTSNPEKIIQRILANNPRIVAILGYRGIQGEYRTPSVELLWGKPPEAIKHSEYGVHYYFDPSRLMFSLGNLFERLRIASLVRNWEVVVDMFAGVGQFTLPVAVHARPRKIHAIEINPLAYEYLTKNIKLNGVEDIVVAYLSDCRELSKKIKGTADRVIMGYLHDTINFLEYALSLIGKSGGIIHLHQLINRDEEEKLIQKIIDLNLNFGYVTNILAKRVVKSYSANKIHLVVDLFVINRDRLLSLNNGLLDN